MTKKETNIAFIDGQNLHLGTTKSDGKWIVDLSRFRIYLNKKYGVEKAYYYLGYASDEYEYLYTKIQEAGFIMNFKKHNIFMETKKKGNVDTDIVFDIMKKLYRKEKFDKVVLVSGDGDYIKLVKFLIKENKFKKVLFPNKKFASSLYKKIHIGYRSNLGNEDIKKKIQYKRKRKGLLR